MSGTLMQADGIQFDLIQNGVGTGSVANALLTHGMQASILRPFLGPDGRSYVVMTNAEGKKVAAPMLNSTATLRKDDWKLLDGAVVKAAKPRLKVFGDIVSAGLTFDVPGGMGKTILETETQSDVNEATMSMDGVRESQGDRPEFSLNALPLPIIHKDFSISARQLAVSRQGGSPFDVTMAELTSRRVAEKAEKLLLGTETFPAYGGGTIYGLTTHTSRNTKAMTLPTASGWTPAVFVNEVLEMKAQSQADYHYGNWKLYTSPNWDIYLDDDYSSQKGDNTLRQRVLQIEGISAVVTVDYLTGYQAILVQMTSDVIRIVNFLPLTTVQWESHGGMKINFKVMFGAVPQIRADHNGNCGIVHGTAS